MFYHTLQVHHGYLYVNGIAQTEGFIAEQPTYTSNLTVRSLSVTSLHFVIMPLSFKHFAMLAEYVLKQHYGLVNAGTWLTN